MSDDETSGEHHGARHLLKPAQERVLAALHAGEEDHVTRARYEELAHVSSSQAAYDLGDLVTLGLVDRVGTGRTTSYRVVREAASRYAAPDEEVPAQGLLLAGLGALALLGLVLVVLTATRPPHIAPLAFPITGERVGAAPDAVPARRPLSRAGGREPVALRLVADREGTRLVARAGSASGRLLWRGTLEPGESLRLRGQAIWLELDAPASLAAYVDGDEADFPRRATRLRVTSAGIRVLARAPLTVQPVSSAPGAAVSPPPATTTSAPTPDSPPSRGSEPSPDAPPSPRR